MRRTLILVLLFAALWAVPAGAQLSWAFQNHCELVYLDSLAIAHGYIRYAGPDRGVRVHFAVVPDQMPRDWSLSFCLGINCYRSEIDYTVNNGDSLTIKVNISTAVDGGQGTCLFLITPLTETPVTDTIRCQGIAGVTCLLLDESFDDVTHPYYEDPLMAIGNLVGTWDVRQWGFPQDHDLAKAPRLVWVGGDESAFNPSADEIAMVGRYINGAGRLLVSASDWGTDFQDAGLFSMYLHTTYGGNVSAPPEVRTRARSWPGHLLAVNGPSTLNRQDQMDRVRLTAQSSRLLSTDSDSEYFPGFITWGTTFYGTYHVGWLGLGFENLGDADSRISFMDAIWYSIDNDTESVAMSDLLTRVGPRLWPNPASGAVTLSLPEAGGQAAIYDAAGRRVGLTSPLSRETRWSTSDWTAGTYHLITSGGERIPFTVVH